MHCLHSASLIGFLCALAAGCFDDDARGRDEATTTTATASDREVTATADDTSVVPTQTTPEPDVVVATQPTLEPEDTAATPAPTCVTGFTLDAAGRCVRWAEAIEAPICFETTMVTLRGNRVLVLGACHIEGADAGGAVSAFLYDQGDDRWTALDGPDVPVARWRPTATAMSDGRVLVAGGATSETPDRVSAAAWIFDPDTLAFTPAPPMSVPRAGHTATLLGEGYGRVLVTGGFTVMPNGQGGGVTASAEIFDPRTGWEPAGSLAVGRAEHTATLVPNGTVIVVGGLDADRWIVSDVEGYHPYVDRWSARAPLHISSPNGTTTLLPDGELLVIGVDTAARSVLSVSGWEPVAPMIRQREGHVAFASGRGIVVVGGVGRDGRHDVGGELYLPDVDRWVTTAAPPSEVWGPGGGANADGFVHGKDGFFRYEIDFLWGRGW